MSAVIPTPSSSQAAPPASPPPEIHRDPDPDPTPTGTVIAPSKTVAETRSDESITSLPLAPRPQSPEQRPPGSVDQPAKIEPHTPDPAPDPRAAPARVRAESERPLPAVPANANVTLSLPVQASLRQRVASDPGNGSSYHVRHSAPPVQRLDLPGSGIFRHQPATHPGEFESRDEWHPARVMSPSQSATFPGSVGARLNPTLDEALKVRNSASLQAKWTMYSINIAIALQVLLGALTTALGASLHGNSVASRLLSRLILHVPGARASLKARCFASKRLATFIRNLRAFILDKGTEKGHDQAVEKFRKEFERLLNASDPNAKRPPLFDPELKIQDEALSMMGLTEEELADLKRARRRQQTNTAVGATGATNGNAR
ncbi:hypothetical protein H4582DRAFT_2080055 [Lactarius indigo]|nr:hypothetical protein H4582DRAFT_2080055 [Lactarius indigo]